MRFAYLLPLGRREALVSREDNSRYILKVTEKIEWANRGEAEWKSVESTEGGRNPGSEEIISCHLL